MKRLTTDKPQNNTSAVLNLFYINKNETWVRGGGPAPDFQDVSLYDYIREIIKTHNLAISIVDNDAMAEHICETLFDGIDTVEGVVSTLYTAAWAFSEIRERLKMYEDTGLWPEEYKKYADAIKKLDIEHMHDLLQAEMDGRLVVLPVPVGADKVAYGLTEPDDGPQYIVTIECDYLEKLEISDDPGQEIVVEVDGWEIGGSDIGKTVFLTREEAEAALKKREEADHEQNQN